MTKKDDANIWIMWLGDPAAGFCVPIRLRAQTIAWDQQREMIVAKGDGGVTVGEYMPAAVWGWTRLEAFVFDGQESSKQPTINWFKEKEEVLCAN